MAIDFFCHSSLLVNEAQEIIDLLKMRHRGLFYSRFIFYDAGMESEVGKEISLEYGLHAVSEFMISLNDKSSADLCPTVLSIVKCAFGVDNIVITSDGGALR